MATTVANGRLESLTVSRDPDLIVRSREFAAPHPRRISQQEGRAIEMLGHAIEYLADEFALECMDRSGFPEGAVHPQIAAIELLMERNREIYFNCPPAPTLGSRLRAMLRLSRVSRP